MISTFQLSEDRHDELLRNVTKNVDRTFLHIEVIEAKDLVPKKSSGLRNSFVVMHVQSAPSQFYNTSVKLGTLNPSWVEQFTV